MSLETLHPAQGEKTIDFFRRNEVTVTHHRVRSLKQHQCHQMANSPLRGIWSWWSRELHTIFEELILPSAINIVSVMTDEATASKLKATPLSDSTNARCNMSKDILEQVNVTETVYLRTGVVNEHCGSGDISQAPGRFSTFHFSWHIGVVPPQPGPTLSTFLCWL